MSAPRSGTDAALAARYRRRRRTARHLGLLAALLGALALIGIVAGGAALGRWELPYVDDPAVAAPPSAEPSYTGPTTPQCGPDGTVAIAAPQETTLRVVNGTGREGLAQATADELVGRGFLVNDVATSRLAAAITAVTYAPGLDSQAVTVANHVGALSVTVSTRLTGVTVTLGADYDGLVAVETVAATLTTAALPECPGVVQPVSVVAPPSAEPSVATT